MFYDVPHRKRIELPHAEFRRRIEVGKRSAGCGKEKRRLHIGYCVFRNVGTEDLPSVFRCGRKEGTVGTADVEHGKFRCKAFFIFDERIDFADTADSLRLYRIEVFEIGFAVLRFILFGKIGFAVIGCGV